MNCYGILSSNEREITFSPLLLINDAVHNKWKHSYVACDGPTKCPAAVEYLWLFVAVDDVDGQ